MGKAIFLETDRQKLRESLIEATEEREMSEILLVGFLIQLFM
jgi:hypothetical protein